MSVSIRQIPHLGRCLAPYATLLCVLAACSHSGPYVPPPPSFQNPPTYPNAQQLQATPTLLDEYMPGTLVTFSTNDSPDSVLTFYETLLLSEGWTFSDSEPGISMRFKITKGCPLYYFEVVTPPDEDAVTSVELRTGKLLCE